MTHTPTIYSGHDAMGNAALFRECPRKGFIDHRGIEQVIAQVSRDGGTTWTDYARADRAEFTAFVARMRKV